MTSRTAVYTTIFPAALPFIGDFFRSLYAQSDQAFDLWIGLDRLERGSVEPFVPSGLIVQWVPARPGDTFSCLRSRAWSDIVKEYAVVILVDSDDVLTQTRVEAAKAKIESADVCVCSLGLIDEMGRSLERLLTVPVNVEDWAAFVSRKNVFGLSNTAYRSATLARVLPLPKEVPVVDWHVATRVLDLGCEVAVDSAVRMLYRLHDRSTTPIIPPFSLRDVETAMRSVDAHYRAVLPHLRSDGFLRGQIGQRRADLSAMRQEVAINPAGFLGRLNANSGVRFWWEMVWG